MIGEQAIGALRRKAAIRTRARALGEQILAGRYAGWRHDPLQERTVLYESFFGNGMLDNPEAIFRHLLDQPDMADLTHIWALDDLAGHPSVVAEFAGDPRVRFVSMGSADYFEALATAKYLVNNATWQQRFAKREGQVYVNTWHGVPLKHMGYDMPGGGIESRNILRNFLSADYLVSGNAMMTEVMYRSAYRLQGIFRGAVIEEGQPRIDRQVQTLKDPAAATEQLKAHGIDLDGRTVVLFAPTWRGNTFAEPQVNAAELVRTVRQLQKRLGNEFLVLLKTHQVVHDAVRRRLGETPCLVSNDLPANVVLGVTDLLVTDYSSI
ncbi:MAG TPA: CDP-glycerol glycerophosphotransferase family protein, partial [Marmoricola sp.]|nr:CDP-glycerol glycerophosphotransferase family protein [Marmoricola sp.]